MKRLLLLLLTLLFLTPALAEETPDALFLAAHPGYEIASSGTCGDTAAAIVTNGTESALCIAERVDGAWTMTIDNPKALLSHEARNYELFIDTDISWSCTPWDTCEEYRAAKKDGVWQMSCVVFSTPWGGSTRESVLSWDDGQLRRKQLVFDENENLLSSEDLMPLPASWLDGMTLLKDFDASLLPTFQADIPTVMEGRALELAAKELLPDDTYIGGSLLAEWLQLLVDKPDGTRVFVCVSWDDGWKLTESTPLPADTEYGNENFTDYLHIPGETTIGVHQWPDGTWGVDFLMPDNGEILLLRRNCVGDGYPSWAETLLIGDHPWSDLTTIDWTTLPHSLDEARAAIDNTGWAMVNNPNPEDRLHLRVKADRDSTSQGKYYNGTFVRVLERGKTWTKVDVFGVQGWMMTEYLAFGDDMETVQRALQPQSVMETLDDAALYATPGGEEIGRIDSSVLVLGLIGDEWYHVWQENNDQTGYVRQADFSAGNG